MLRWRCDTTVAGRAAHDDNDLSRDILYRYETTRLMIMIIRKDGSSHDIPLHQAR